MRKLTVDQVEAKLKRINSRRTQWNHETVKSEQAPASAWPKALGLDWQVRNQIFKGCNGKCTFDPVTMIADSYGHWPFVQLIKGKVVFNAYRYSVTTSGHQSVVRGLMARLGIKIDLEVNTGASLNSFKYCALREMYHRLFTLEIASARKNANDRSREIRETKRDIAMARKLGAVCRRAEIKSIQTRCLETETNRLAAMKLALKVT